jgi:CMP-N,N'-diacetyllegionaminic acid synthase
MVYVPSSGDASVLAVTPARKGSKGIVRKNLRPLGGTPLLAHSILTAKKSQYIDRIVVSTDDEVMQKTALDYGAEAPFLRPAELASDTTTDYPVLKHCLDWLKEHEGYEPAMIAYLWPTGALRTVEDVDAAIELLARHPDADSVRTVNEAPKSPYKMWKLGERFMTPLLTLEGVKDSHHAPRQSLPKVYQTNPYALVLWKRTMDRYGSTIGKNVLPLVIDRPVVDIDTELDLIAAEWLLKQQSAT